MVHTLDRDQDSHPYIHKGWYEFMKENSQSYYYHKKTEKYFVISYSIVTINVN